MTRCLIRGTHLFTIGLVMSLPLATSSTAGEPLRSEPGRTSALFTVMIQEEAGIPRPTEPTQASLPFAAGILEDEKDVAILDASGKAIPAQFEVLARWDDLSVRWLLARFLAELPAHGKVTLTVRLGAGTSTPGGPGLARKEGQDLVVDTGVIHVEIRRAEPGAFTVSDRQGGGLLDRPPQLVLYSPTGRKYRCAPPRTIELEVNGPLYASVFLSGPMEAEAPGFDGILEYETRLHFWRGVGRILAEHTVVAVGSVEDGITVVDGIVVEMKAADGFAEYVFGGQGESHTGSVNKGDQFRLEQTCAYWHECGHGPDPVAEPVKYVVLEADFRYQLKADQGRLLAEGEKSPGWCWVAGAGRSVGVAVRDFWEEGPKALGVSADGAVSVECYAHWRAKPGEARPSRSRTPDYSTHPNLDSWFAAENEGIEGRVRRFLNDTQYPGPVRRGPFRFGRGRAKTTDVLYVFGKADDKRAEVDVLAARRHALIPVVDPRYLASTRALPFLWAADSDVGLPMMTKGVHAMFENWKKHATRYGFLHFGDDQCAFGYNRTVPSTTDDQEYDTTQGLTMQFASTGDPAYLRWANTCARHFMDVDQVHPTGELNFHGYTSNSDYHEEPGVIDMQGHPYIGGIVNHYMLTGDRRSLRGIRRLARALRGYGDNARERLLQSDGRSISRPGVCLSAMYDLTRDPADLAPVKEMVEAINDLTGDVTNELRGEPPFRMWWFNHSEMCYHVRELLVRYHAATGDERTLATLQKNADLYVHDLWDAEHEAWRGFLGAPHDYNDPYQFPVARKGRSRYTLSGYAAAELGMPFAYLAGVTGNNDYLIPFLDYLDNIGSDYAKSFGNRRFARRLLWSMPFVSMLPDNWRAERDTIVQREAFRADLRKGRGLVAWTPEGEVEGKVHGEALWADSPFGEVLRTYGESFASFPAPEDILAMPGTVAFWVCRDEVKWDRRPWAWYGEYRALLHIGSDARETNALDIMMRDDELWVRLYDQRGWEMGAIHGPSPMWAEGKWHHIAVVWNRFNLTVFTDGKLVGRETRMALPDGGQTAMYLGWRPTNPYGQADYCDLRVFRTPLPERRIKGICESTRPGQTRPGNATSQSKS